MRKIIVLAAFVLALAGCSSDKAATGTEGEAASQPVVTSPRDFRDVKAEAEYLVTIEADKEYDIGVKGLASNLEMKAGETLRFQLTDLLESGKWVVRANDDQVVGVKLGVFKTSLEKGVRSVTAVDLNAVKPGTSVLEMNYINDLQSIKRVFRCCITVK